MSLYPHLLLILCSLDMFACIDSGEGGSLKVNFEDNAIKLSKSNVSRFVVGLRHFTIVVRHIRTIVHYVIKVPNFVHR